MPNMQHCLHVWKPTATPCGWLCADCQSRLWRENRPLMQIYSGNCSKVLIEVRSFLKRWVKDMPKGVEADKLTVWMEA